MRCATFTMKPSELLSIYENGGRDALLKLYSKAHAFKIAKRLKAALVNT